jgi:acyl-CoA reductase-like NAD-dependent aldehyde dehydrogenase
VSAGAISARRSYRPSEPYRLHIGGDWVAAAESFDAIDPSVGEPWARIPQASPADVERAVAAARAALPAWRRSTPATRQAALWAMADAIEAEPERWSRLLATENGRPIREALVGDIPTCAGRHDPGREHRAPGLHRA